MEVNNYNTYFNVIFKCVGKEDTICHFFPQPASSRFWSMQAHLSLPFAISLPPFLFLLYHSKTEM